MAPTRTSIDEAVSPDGPGRTVEEERCSKADEQVDLRVELLPTAVPHCERSDFTADEFASAWWDKTVASTSRAWMRTRPSRFTHTLSTTAAMSP